MTCKTFRFRSVLSLRRKKPNFFLIICSLVVPPGLTSNLFAQDGHNQISSIVQPFIKSYCVDCHGRNKTSGERRFDNLKPEIASDNTLIDYQDILDQLNLGEMPPADELQPKDNERKAVISVLTEVIRKYHETRQTGMSQTILRRLNSREYHNTVRDLFKLNMTMFDPTENFPLDQISDHLDNQGQTLVTSGHLLDRYLTAAESVVDKAIYPIQKPSVQTWHFKDGFRQQPEIDQVFKKVNQFAWMTLFDVPGADKHEGAYGPIHAFAKGVPHDGYYEIRLRAEAVNRLHPYDPEFLGTDPNEPLRLGIVAGNQQAGPLHKPQPVEPLLAEIDLADEQQWYTARVWLDAGFTPRFTFQNGLMDARNLWSKLIRKYPDQFPKPKSRGIVEMRFNAIKHGKLPQIRIHEILIEGPHFDEWPSPSQKIVFGDRWRTIKDTGDLTLPEIEKLITSIAHKAYRRPLNDQEIFRIMKVVRQRLNSGRSSLEAYRDGLQAVLCSPGFLYFQQPDNNRLRSFARASRLSYFLWSSMPDDELMNLAQNNELENINVFSGQVERMLADPRSTAFIHDFLDSWLTLRDLGSTPPDRSRFRDFYHYNLGSAMKTETREFTRHLLENNLDIGLFLNSDFTFVNRPLARFYKTEIPTISGFQKVSLENKLRGGLLGQASILTVTANGIDTSPVVRGVWILENILGTPPSPPPPDVEPLDPDIRGAKTIRDQLRKHRSVASCNDCHQRIDPLGFALENFDPIGQIRNVYPNKAKIETDGALPNGNKFSDAEGLKEILLDRKELFASSLARKMLSYAIGRQLMPSDRPAIDKIVEHLSQNEYGFRDLVHQVVLSEPFQSK